MPFMKEQGKIKSVCINVKVAEKLGKRESIETLSGTPGVMDVIQTFPDETDKELASLYLVKIEEKQVKRALQKLRQLPEIDYAEETAPRKLIKQSSAKVI